MLLFFKESLSNAVLPQKKLFLTSSTRECSKHATSNGKNENRISSYPLSFILTPYMTFSHTHTSAYLSTWENVCFPSFSLKQTDLRHCLRLQALLQCKLMDIQNHTWNRKLINSVTEFPLHIGNGRLPHRRTPRTSTHLRMTSKINDKANFAERHNTWSSFDAILLIMLRVLLSDAQNRWVKQS